MDTNNPPARVLFVDDEENVLLAMRRMLHGRYESTFASSPGEALKLVETQSFDVIVSDMRMPAMSGTELLKRSRARNPDAIRMILSGQSDLEAAAAAINDVGIFRFLIKPANRDSLSAALDAAIEQRRLLKAEKELLERTLAGSIDALSETMAIVNPLAFGRSRRLKRIVAKLAAAAGLTRVWPLEMAASLSQLGSITIPADVAERAYSGHALEPNEQQMVERAASVPAQLLKHIPRLEPVIALLEAHGGGTPSINNAFEVSVLRVAAVLERAETDGVAFDDVITQLQKDQRNDATLINAAKRMRPAESAAAQRRMVDLQGLMTGMVLVADVKTRAGALLITRGHSVSEALLARLRNFATTVGVHEPIEVMSAPEAEAVARAA